MAKKLFFLCFLCVSLVHAIEKEPVEVYRQRRQALLKELSSGITVIFGVSENSTGDAIWPFRQEDNYFYLTGQDEPGGVLVLLPPSSDPEARSFPREILFLPARNLVQERWTGAKVGPNDPDIASKLGFDQVMEMRHFEREMRRALPVYNAMYTLLPSRGDERGFDAANLDRLKLLAPFAESRDARGAISRLRMVKSKTELALIERAVACSMDAHREAMKSVRSGSFEYEIAALMQYTFQREGCQRPAYGLIVGSGFNSTVLHYERNERRMDSGDLVVIDVAGEYSGYAADITRTLPVSGKFSDRQREIYEIVLGAQKAAIAAIKPGMTLGRTGDVSIHKIAYDYINTHGKDLKGDPLGKYFIHGLSHHVGLNVHDANDPTRPLAPGMVITVEPGIYIPEERLGVRIEDMVLVTETGAKLLTEALPREIAEVEKALARR